MNQPITCTPPTRTFVGLPYEYCGECEDCCEDGVKPCYDRSHHPMLVTHSDGWIELNWGTLLLLPSDPYDASRQQLAEIAELRGTARELAIAFYVCVAIATWCPWRLADDAAAAAAEIAEAA